MTTSPPCLLLQTLVPDYSLESHQKDHEQFVNVTRNRRRRAKALLDFERHDDDELGFRKNDIITVSHRLCMKNWTWAAAKASAVSPESGHLCAKNAAASNIALGFFLVTIIVNLQTIHHQILVCL